MLMLRIMLDYEIEKDKPSSKKTSYPTYGMNERTKNRFNVKN